MSAPLNKHLCWNSQAQSTISLRVSKRLSIKYHPQWRTIQECEVSTQMMATVFSDRKGVIFANILRSGTKVTCDRNAKTERNLSAGLPCVPPTRKNTTTVNFSMTVPGYTQLCAPVMRPQNSDGQCCRTQRKVLTWHHKIFTSFVLWNTVCEGTRNTLPPWLRFYRDSSQLSGKCQDVIIKSRHGPHSLRPGHAGFTKVPTCSPSNTVRKYATVGSIFTKPSN
jgi:hypothetical protein